MSNDEDSAQNSAAETLRSEHEAVTREQSKGFLDFPAELRNYIYDLVAQNNGSTVIYAPTSNPNEMNPSPALVNRQMRREYLARYHRERGLKLFLPSSSADIKSVQDWINFFHARISMTRSFFPQYATTREFQAPYLACNLLLRGGVGYEAGLRRRKGVHPDNGDSWWSPDVHRSGEDLKELKEEIAAMLKGCQVTQGGGEVVMTVDLLCRICHALVAAAGHEANAELWLDMNS